MTVTCHTQSPGSCNTQVSRSGEIWVRSELDWVFPHRAYLEYWVTFSGIKHWHYLSVLISIPPHNSCAGLCHRQKPGINEEERSQSHTCAELEHWLVFHWPHHCHFPYSLSQRYWKWEMTSGIVLAQMKSTVRWSFRFIQPSSAN